MPNVPKIAPVILSGGSGTRLWPASRPGRPKQLIALVGRHTLLQATALRIADRELFNPPVVVTSSELGVAVVDQLTEVGVEARAAILEPEPRGTAPAAATAALMLAEEDADAVVAILPSDHSIAGEAALAIAMKTAVNAASADALAVFGIPPTAPETGYGYIRQGIPFSGIEGCFYLASFVEKPDRATATRYLASGDYLWNSGMFVFSTRGYLRELQCLEPVMLDACRRALDDAVQADDFLRIGAKAFADCPTNSIDRAVMERTDAAVVIPVELGWSDVGAWAAVWEVGEKDALENVVFGEVELANVEQSLIYNERSTRLEVAGITGLVVAVSAAAVLVAERARSAEIGALVPHLGADDALLPSSDATVQMADGFQVVRIGCREIQVLTSPTSVRVIGNTAGSNAWS